ncbi:MAG: cupin domain-containing protein [Thermosynechococcaceae cyanobacterium]
MTTLLQMKSSALQIHDQLEYPESGVLSKVLLQDKNCQYTLFCLAAGTEIAEHTAARNATVHVLEGQGTLTLKGDAIALSPGTFVVMPAHAPHALKASENLAFLLTLSESGV